MKRINMMLNDSETEKLEQIKSHIGLKTTTDTIRYLISSVHLKLLHQNSVAYLPNNPNPNPYPFSPPNPYATSSATLGPHGSPR